MPELLLCLDWHLDGPPDLEREVFGPGFRFEVFRWSERDRVPAELLAAARGLLCNYAVRVDAALLARMPRLRVVTRCGVGFDNIDIEAAGRAGVAVLNVPDYGTMDIADHAIGLALAFLRGISFYTSALHEDPVGNWTFAAAPTVRRLATLTFGVVGLGRIGTATALRARALGMRVLFYDPYRPTGTELALGIERRERLEDLLAEADVVSIHTPLTPETRGMIGAAALAAIKPGAILINTARGPIVDLDAVLAALRSGRLAGAGLDVLPEEPPSPDHPLIRAWREPGSPLRHRLILTPHAAWYTPSGVIDVRRKSAVATRAFLETGRSRDLVNEPFLDRAAAAARLASGGPA
ncbi:MAG: C-terminal binding protein [Geminicoccaceae bacterium]|nr:C-terminal binding protein [Geminicoccaceae bacterium]